MNKVTQTPVLIILWLGRCKPVEDPSAKGYPVGKFVFKVSRDGIDPFMAQFFGAFLSTHDSRHCAAIGEFAKRHLPT